MPLWRAARRQAWTTLRLFWIVPLALSLLLAVTDRAPVAASHGRAFIEFLRGNFDPAWSPDGRRILMISASEKTLEIVVTDAQGGGRRRLSEGYSPIWSPDGRAVAFFGGEEIRLVNADGRGQRRLTSWLLAGNGVWEFYSGAGRPLSWSPDGRRLAFNDGCGPDEACRKPGEYSKQIYVINADGSRRTRLTAQGDNFAPAWSPDGQRLAFTTRSSERDPPLVAVINADGTGRKTLTNQASWAPVWSPDGRRLAFLSAGSEGGQQINMMNADGSGSVRLATRTATEYFALWPGLAWSPDGRRIAFHTEVARSPNKVDVQINVINTDGTGQLTLTGEGVYWAAVWAPDSRRFVFNGIHVKPDGTAGLLQVFAVNADGTGLKRISGP